MSSTADLNAMEKGTKIPEVRIGIGVSSLKLEDDNDDKVGCTEVCAGSCVCFSILFAFGLIAGAIAYWVFAIKGLVEDHHFVKECPHSSIWTYVLTCLIISLVSFRDVRNKDDDDNNSISFAKAFICFSLSAAMAIWGVIEFNTDQCDGIHNSIIWTMTEVNFILHFINCGIILCGVPIYAYLSE